MDSYTNNLEQMKEVERRKARDNDYWSIVLGTEAGRYVINCILEEIAPVYRMSFSADNPHVTSFREGERNAGNKIMARAFTDRDSYYRIMREEHLARERGDKNARTGT